MLSAFNRPLSVGLNWCVKRLEILLKRELLLVLLVVLVGGGFGRVGGASGLADSHLNSELEARISSSATLRLHAGT